MQEVFGTKLSDDKTVLIKIESGDVDSKGYFKVPDGVRTIGAGASEDVKKKLMIIDINSVNEIEYCAFTKCKYLEQVIGTPRVIKEAAFFDCERLGKFDFSKTDSLDVNAFSYCALKSIDLASIDYIPSSAFDGCEYLHSVTGSPKIIGDAAFHWCSELVSIDLTKAETIGNMAFRGCEQLKNIKLGDLHYLGYGAFFECGVNCYEEQTEKTMRIKVGNFDAVFAKAEENSGGVIIGGIIDLKKNAYTDITGNPFILAGEMDKVYLTENKEKFLELFNAS